MAKKYVIAPIKDLVGGRLKPSVLNTGIRRVHEPFCLNWRPDSFNDWRNDVRFQFGPTIKEEKIAEHWSQYEAQYRDARRLNQFWQTTLSDVIVEPNYLVVIHGGSVIRESFRLIKELKAIFPDVDEAILTKSRQNQDKFFETETEFTPNETVNEAFLLGSGLYRNYFNWTIRYTARIPFFTPFNRRVKLLVPDTSISYISGTLEFFNLGPDRIKVVDKPVRVKRLHVIAPTAIGRYELSPLMINNTRHNPEVEALTVKDSYRRLYIPRYDAKLRCVVNEDKLIERLTRYGFSIFDSGAHSIKEQITAFKSAEVVVAPHGAGLANIVFSAPGTKVVEFIPEGYDQGATSYRSLADLYGLHYYPLFAKEYAVDPRGNRGNSDIEVDIEEFDNLLRNKIL